MEFQINGIKNKEVLKQRSKFSANHQASCSLVTSFKSQTPFKIQKLWIENICTLKPVFENVDPKGAPLTNNYLSFKFKLLIY